jgi:hypothetical protein
MSSKDWIKPGEVLAELRHPKPDAVDLLKQICAQEGYQFFAAKIHDTEQVGKIEIILPKNKVQEFQTLLDVRSIGQIFIVDEKY